MQSVKLVVVGDGATGKTCLLISYTSNSFPRDYTPTVFDNYAATVMLDKTEFTLSLWDTAGPEDYDRLRPLSYPQTDVFLVCFGVNNRIAIENVKRKWVPEITHYCPLANFILVATKVDLREDATTLERLEHMNKKILTPEDGIRMARDTGAAAYCECSALTQAGLHNVFNTAIRLTLFGGLKKTKKPNKGFQLGKIFHSLKITNDKKELPGEIEVHYKLLPQLITGIYGHTTAITRNILYIIGGSNSEGEPNKSVLAFDLRWERWIPQHIETPPLQFHTAEAFENKIYIFGGKSNGYHNDLYKFDTESNSITKITANGQVPSPRYGHSAVIYKRKMYVFGGYDNCAMSCNDLHSFDIDKELWIKENQQGTLPETRFMHSAVMINQAMYVYAGSGDNGILGDIHRFNFADATWSKLKTKGKSAPRTGHKAVASPNGMYVIGGYQKIIKNEKYFANFSLLDVNLLEWFNVPVSGADKPIETYNQSCSWDYQSSSLFVVGGKVGQNVVSNALFMLSIIKSFNEILPNPILQHIFTFLQVQSVVHLSSTCKSLRAISEDEKLWKLLCNRTVPYFYMDESTIPSCKEYLMEYMRHPLIVSIPKSVHYADEFKWVHKSGHYEFVG